MITFRAFRKEQDESNSLIQFSASSDNLDYSITGGINVTVTDPAKDTFVIGKVYDQNLQEIVQ